LNFSIGDEGWTPKKFDNRAEAFDAAEKRVEYLGENTAVNGNSGCSYAACRQLMAQAG